MRTSLPGLGVILASVLAVSGWCGGDESGVASRLFTAQVQPMLKAKCLGCHGEGEVLEADLDLTSREGMLAGGILGPSLVPGKPDESLLYEVVLRTSYPVMPPKAANALTDAEQAALKAWIEEGAPWPSATAAAPGGEGPWNPPGEPLWSTFPPVRPEVPTPRAHAERVRTPIDAFLLAALGEKQVAPAARADRRTLIRRVTYDLIGLPPTPPEIEAFLKDPRDDDSALDAVIERLLASPQYGEQWGRHWLDVVRYADTSGYSNDFDRPNAWRYRDYVIRSLNEDRPFDRLIREQVAGDEIDPESAEMKIAAGFLRMGPWEHTGMSVAAQTRQLFLDDVTHNTVTSFLGLTMGCAKCHDHKFDPLPTRDYYSVQAVFATTLFDEPKASFLAGENVAGFDPMREALKREVAFNQAKLDEIESKRKAQETALREQYGAQRLEDLPEEVRPKDNRFGLTDADQERQRVYSKRLELLKEQVKRFEPLAFSVKDGASDPEATHVLIGGALEAPGDPVEPGVLSAFLASLDAQSAPIPTSAAGRRLALARWIASPENPLTARVIVNRVWQGHFGKGLVATPNNFGVMGKRPTHPELLDWLAVEFIEGGWSLKELHRLMLRSDAYRRASAPADAAVSLERDPENLLLGHFRARRLTAEELRDSILAVAGELNPEEGGPPAYPELNRDAAQQPRQIMGTIAPMYKESARRVDRHRRTIYTAQIRNLPNPMLQVFNAADMNNSCELREESTVATQVFALFNGEFPHAMALAMARRLEQVQPELERQVSQAFREALGRPPTEEEAARCVAHVQAMREVHEGRAPQRPEQPREIQRHHIGELSGAPFTFAESGDLGDYEPNLHAADVPAHTRALAELCLILMNTNEFAYVY